MNKQKELKELFEYIEEYKERDQYLFHMKFIEELSLLLSKDASGHEKELFNIMIKQFGFVNTLNTRVNEADSNEILKDTGDDGDYYSLHIKSKTLNLRMLMRSTEENLPVFLGIFHERSGKRVSDYTGWVPIIKARYNQIKEEIENE